MQYNIKGTNVEVSHEVRAYVERQLTRLEKYTQGAPVHADVEVEHHGLGGAPYRAEFTLLIGSVTHRAEAVGAGLHEAIDVAAGELTRELSRTKDRSLTLMRRAAAKFKSLVRGFRG